MLTREQMAAAIAGGGSVGYRGRVITSEEDLPTDAELAGNDPAAQASAADGIRAQIAALQAQLASVAPPPVPDPDKATKQELLDHAQTVGVEVDPSATKAEIVQAIQAGQPVNAAAPAETAGA